MTNELLYVLNGEIVHEQHCRTLKTRRLFVFDAGVTQDYIESGNGRPCRVCLPSGVSE